MTPLDERTAIIPLSRVRWAGAVSPSVGDGPSTQRERETEKRKKKENREQRKRADFWALCCAVVQ